MSFISQQSKSALAPAVTVTARPTVYALPRPIPHPPPKDLSSAPTNFSSTTSPSSVPPSNFTNPPKGAVPAPNEEVENVEENESDPENSHAAVSTAKDGQYEKFVIHASTTAWALYMGTSISYINFGMQQ